MLAVSVYVPVESPETLGETVIVDGAAPEVGLSRSQVLVALAVQFSTPLPALVTLIVCEPGSEPIAPKKVIEVGLTDRTAVFTARVTGIEIGEFAAPGAETVRVPLYVPSARPEGLADTVIVPGVNAEETVAVNQV